MAPPARDAPGGRPPAPGRAVEAAAALLGARHGLRFDGTSRDRLRRALQATAAARDAPPEAVAAAARTDAALADELLDRATLPETSWFRDPALFATVTGRAAAAVRAAQDDGRTAVLWSAGCAHGQEPYSLAIALLEAGLEGFKVVATDVAPSAVARTAAGTYGERELRGLSAGRRARWLEPAGGGRRRVVAAVRERVRPLRHGLSEARPPVPSGSCELVLCRNVLIYLDADAIRTALERVRDALRPGGLLVLGAGESLLGGVRDLRVVPMGPRAFAYERAERRRTEQPRAPRRRAGDVRAPASAAPAGPAAAARAAAPGAAARGAAGDVRAPAPASPAAAAASAGPARPRPAPPPSAATFAERMRAGEAAAAEGDHAAAAAAFRHAAALDPDAPLAHLGLGLALEALGDPGAARAYRAARAALDRGGRAAVQDALGGFRAEELARLLADKLGAGGGSR